MATAYTIDTDRPTDGPWRVTPFGDKYASVTMSDGRKFFVGVERAKRVRIAFKPRGQNYGWRYFGFVRDSATGRATSQATPSAAASAYVGCSGWQG
jgi:hypothetical protein